MSDYHREYADQADARIRELEDKLAGAVEVLNGAGVKMCELIDQLAAYKVAVEVLAKEFSEMNHHASTGNYDNGVEHQGADQGDVLHVTFMENCYTRAMLNPICKAAIDAAKGGE